MPPTKSPKRTGAPKAKGAVRAKSGCYTCRIRRKKCDENADERGRCQTCVRLRLECLGFGAKRPEWLRENTRVVDLRVKIKTFLASQGLIKGHSGTGPRNGDDDYLRLTYSDSYSSASESPPSQQLSLAPDDYRPPHNTSAMRDMRDQTWMYNDQTDSRGESPYDGSHSSGGGYDVPLQYQAPLAHNSSNSLVPWSAGGMPTISSSFSPTYHMSFQDDTIFEDPALMDNSSALMPFGVYLRGVDALDDLTIHYMESVVKLQYMLTDPHEIEIIFPSVQAEGFSRDAARLLASVHFQRLQHPQTPALCIEETKSRYTSLATVLAKHSVQDDDAMAALHVISAFLFDGGQGDWEKWLKIAATYARCVLMDPRYCGNSIDALRYCDPKQRLVVKTAIWFDVLASVSTFEPPILLDLIRSLFGPQASRVYDPTIPLSEELSMVSVMGCPNTVVWALAEISYLAHWKQNQQANGCLSIPDLVDKGNIIEAELRASVPSPLQPAPTPTQQSRYHTSEIFRASARVYLRSVVSGDYPHVPEIVQGVEDTMQCLQLLPLDSSTVVSQVVRSTVFSIFLCGSLTENPRHQVWLLEQLGPGGGPGNRTSVSKALEKVWQTRSPHRREPVMWRKLLQDDNLLLI